VLPDHDDGRVATIAVDIEARGNRTLLERVLGDRYRLTPQFDDDFDLAIVDLAGLRRKRETLLQLRAQQRPVVLPVLLFVDGRRSPDSLLRQELGVSVDDAVHLPRSAPELVARVQNLLRLRELTREQQSREESIQRTLDGTSRALQTLNAVNELLVRIEDENELLQAVCRVVVEQEDYRLAWVGFVQDDAPLRVLVDAAAGPASDYARDLCLTYEERGDGPAWRAIETGETQVVPDFRSNRVGHLLSGWLDHYELTSVIALPLHPEIGPRGALAIYSGTRDEFGQGERDLLERLATNLEYGINALRTDRDRERQRDEIWELAYLDPLTALPNRNRLVERLTSLLEGDAHQGLAVLFLDFDHFKLVNDALGHVAGDGVLRQLAHRLSDAVRDTDLVARQGGDEFIVVTATGPRSASGREEMECPDLSAQAAMRLARRIRDRISEPLSVQDYTRRLGVSIGISVYPLHGDTAEELIDKADAAMYQAKDSAQDSIAFYEESMSRAHQRRLLLETRLHGALERDELVLHYQPIFDLTTSSVIGAEALLRWVDQDGSWISPGDFMPIAEETGLIVSIGDWVLDQAARQLAAWHAAGLQIGMAVNVSVRQLYPGGDGTRFADLVKRHVDPRWIELEVTESVLIHEPEMIESTLRDLHNYGFGLAIDDFGTGYSSLGRLRALPLDTLKIDKSFVSGAGERDKDDMIVRAVAQLARSLSVSPLAEGIETDQQRRNVLNCGCDRGQGFWFSPALPPDQFLELAMRPATTAEHD
jgi:diguanylate cyclase (GGDEF)-like protein